MDIIWISYGYHGYPLGARKGCFGLDVWLTKLEATRNGAAAALKTNSIKTS